MNKIPTYTKAVVLTLYAALLMTREGVIARLDKLDNDRGEVPAWAYVTGATAILAGVVYAAVKGYVNKWLGKL